MTRATARRSIMLLELVTNSVLRGCMKPGSGLSPRTLSTTIFSATGVSSARGADIRLSASMPSRCSR